MSRFAQYYIKYHHDFGSYDWEDRQKNFGSFFETDASVTFGTGSPSEEQKASGVEYEKTYNHRVYHLANNPNIIVMQFANSIDIPVELKYQPALAKDEPSCFVIIDNRTNMRTVAIQKRKKAFGSPSQVAAILSNKIDSLLYKSKCYKFEILPVFYPEDLFQAWENLQQNVIEMRFGIPEMSLDEVLKKVEDLKEMGKEYFDDSLMTPLMQLAVEAKKAKYKQLYKIMPEDKNVALYVDKTSVYMKNLITMSRALNMPVELVTKDSGTFRCFVETDEDNTDKVVCREFDSELLEQLFTMTNKAGDALETADINRIEGELVEMLNSMKHESEDDEGDLVA